VPRPPWHPGDDGMEYGNEVLHASKDILSLVRAECFGLAYQGWIIACRIRESQSHAVGEEQKAS